MESESHSMSDILKQIEGLDDLELLGERCTSNPLRRCVSNISCTSQEGATFVPLGRLDDGDNHDGQVDSPPHAMDAVKNNVHVDVEVDVNRVVPVPSPNPTGMSYALGPIPGLPPHFFLNCQAAAMYNTPLRCTNDVLVPPMLQPFNINGMLQQVPPPIQAVTPVPSLVPAAHNKAHHTPTPVPPAPQHSPDGPCPTMPPVAVAANAPALPPVEASPSVSASASVASREQSIVAPPAQPTKAERLRWMSIAELIRHQTSLEDLLEHKLISRFFRDQNGSRYIQDRLNDVRARAVDEATRLLDEILRHIIFESKDLLHLSQDVYGNYVIQILFQIGTPDHHELLFKHLLKKNVCRLTHSFYGCRVIQTAMDYLPMEQIEELVRELDNKAIHECIIGQNANHVIQKVLSCDLPQEDIEFIIDCIVSRLYFYSTHIFGCRIVQCIIKHYSECRVLPHIAEKKALILNLSKSEYGNYVVQDMVQLRHTGKELGDKVQSVRLTVFRNVLALSTNKYGSNVVEKCLMTCSDKERDVLMQQLTMKSAAVLLEMVQDKYANYVIQKLLVNANHKQQSKLIYLIEKHIPNIRSLNYGKHISEKIRKIRNKYKSRR